MVDGGFATLESELQGVLEALRGVGISVLAIHQHMTGEQPRFIRGVVRERRQRRRRRRAHRAADGDAGVGGDRSRGARSRRRGLSPLDRGRQDEAVPPHARGPCPAPAVPARARKGPCPGRGPRTWSRTRWATGRPRSPTRTTSSRARRSGCPPSASTSSPSPSLTGLLHPVRPSPETRSTRSVSGREKRLSRLSQERESLGAIGGTRTPTVLPTGT